jgi:beta-phosphoglucomutase
MHTAILFDMDGVLVDSEPVINAAAIKGLAEYGITAHPDDFLPFVGAGEDRYIGGVAEKYGHRYETAMKTRVYQIYLDMVDDQIKVFAGIHELLAALTAAGHTLALASSADRIKIDANLRAAGIDPAIFTAVISSEDVVAKKPAPDIYLTAAKALGAEPAHCLVVEDALNGIIAAHAAGIKCVAVATSFSRDQLVAAGADVVIDAISDLANIVDGLF